MKVCVLFNPRAGSAAQIEALRAVLAAERWVTIRELGPDEELAQHAAEAGRAGFDVVAVAGGDGSVHAAVNGLMFARPQARLAVLPLGTGNDFCRTMAIPLDPVAAAGLLRTAKPRSIDAVRVSGGYTGFLVNAATGGFSGLVASGVTPELKAFWGPLAYLRGALGPVSDWPRFRVTFRFDSGPAEELDVLNVVVANGRTAAGGIPVAPTANPEDGLLDVVVVRAAEALDLSVIAARLMHGDYLGDENVLHRRARRMELTADPPITFSIDGELCEGSRFAFAVVPAALRVLAGPDYTPEVLPEPLAEEEVIEESVTLSAGNAAPGTPPKGLVARLFGLLTGLLLLVKRTPVAYTLGFAAAGIGVLAFAWLAQGVVGGKWAELNHAGMEYLHQHATPELTQAAQALTALGGAAGIVAAVVVLLAFFVWRKQYVNAAALVMLLAGLGGIELIVKPAFAIARPTVFPHLTPAEGLSFPSGHATRGVGLYGFLAVLLVSYGPRSAWRWLAAGIGGLLAVGICWSRVYLAVHWPTDVIAGGLAAAAWVAACFVARHYAMRRPRGAGV